MKTPYHLTRVISKYGWDPDLKESRRLEYEDKYDALSWDDFIGNVGYLLEGHKGQELTIKIKLDGDAEEE